MSLIRPRTVDILKLKLSTEQGFVLSRLDREMTMGELSALSGIEESQLRHIVVRLAMQGAVDLEADFTPDVTASGVPEVMPEVMPEVVVAPAPPPPPAAVPMIAPLSEPMLDPVEESATVGIAIDIRGITDVGKSRTNNEDALTVIDVASGNEIPISEGAARLALGDSRLLLAVSDGMGGESAGEVASALVLESLREHLFAHSTDEPAAALANAVHHAHARVVEAAAEPGRTGMGATLVAVAIDGTTAITAEIGDSRIYLFRQGVLTQISNDQTHLAILRQQGLLTDDLLQSRAKNIVLQACGKGESLIVAQRRVPLCNGDCLLLCSDGLTLHVQDSEIAAVLAQFDPATFSACETLVNMANERGGKDNITVLIAHVPEGAATQAGAHPIQVLREFRVGEEA